MAATSDDDVCSWEDPEKREHAGSGCAPRPFFSLGVASVEHESNAIAFEGGCRIMFTRRHPFSPFLVLLFPCALDCLPSD